MIREKIFVNSILHSLVRWGVAEQAFTLSARFSSPTAQGGGEGMQKEKKTRRRQRIININTIYIRRYIYDEHDRREKNPNVMKPGPQCSVRKSKIYNGQVLHAGILGLRLQYCCYLNTYVERKSPTTRIVQSRVHR